MRRPLHLVLILCVALTGISLGMARGTVMQAGQVVLCTGDAVTVVDHPQGPSAPHVCPDMALALLAATPAAVDDPVVFRCAGDAGAAVSVPRGHGRKLTRPAARGPPSSGISERNSV